MELNSTCIVLLSFVKDKVLLTLTPSEKLSNALGLLHVD